MLTIHRSPSETFTPIGLAITSQGKVVKQFVLTSHERIEAYNPGKMAVVPDCRADDQLSVFDQKQLLRNALQKGKP